MPGMHELSEVSEADRGLLQANDLHLVSNEAVEAALDSLVIGTSWRRVRQIILKRYAK
jgi:hypothetical protein